MDIIYRHRQLYNVPEDEEVLKLMDRYLMNYADMIIRSLKELEINVQTTPIIIVGGGASVVKNYCSVKLPNIDYKLDIKANGKGYEMMARIALKNARR